MKTVYQIRMEGFGKNKETINTPWGSKKDAMEQMRRTINSGSYFIGSVIFFELMKADYEKNVFMGNPVLVKKGYVKIVSKIIWGK